MDHPRIVSLVSTELYASNGSTDGWDRDGLCREHVLIEKIVSS